MDIYVVMCSTDDDTSIISIHENLDTANEYARRSIGDTWRVQDGYPFNTVTRSDGTKAYTMSWGFSSSCDYYVDKRTLQK